MKKYFVLWKNGELQTWWATSKAEALKMARAYKRDCHIEDTYPVKTITDAEAIEIIRARLFGEVEQ